MTAADPDAPLRQTTYAVFAFLWAFAALIHNGSVGDLVLWNGALPLTLAAILVMLRPSSLPRLLLLVATCLPAYLEHAPFITNHWLAFGLGSAWIALRALGWLAAHRRLPSGPELLARWAPELRAALFVFYFWVVFHKLNTSFFDPSVSCASTMYGWLAGKLPMIPDAAWTSRPAMLGTLLAEAAIPVLLALRTTRLLAVVGGLLFHGVLGVNGFYNFTAYVTAMYALFLGDGFALGLARLARSRRAAAASRRAAQLARAPLAAPAVLFSFIALAAAPTALGFDPELTHDVCWRATQIVWLLASLAFGITLLAILRQERRLRGDAVSLRPSTVGWVLVAVFFLNGLSPYLGFKTENSFAMFSNLQTEGPYWNHLFVPRAVRVFHFQDRVVEVIDSSETGLASTGQRGILMTFFEFHRIVSTRPEISVRYRLGDQEYDVPRVADDPILSVPPHPLLARLLWFRPVSRPEANRCRH